MLTLNKRVWVLAERLYIHAHKKEAFLRLLRQHDIDYPGDNYNDFNTIKGLYTFMSEDDLTFADFMDLIPAYKYLPLLADIVFDPDVQKTAADNWNYYGEYINNWLPLLLDLLNLAGVTIDQDAKKLAFPEIEPAPPAQDFLQEAFGDTFIDYVRREANEAHRDQLFLSVMFLSRKLLESVTVRIMEVVFPKLVNRAYSPDNHSIWYDTAKGRYHNFDVLLDNLKAQAHQFHEDEGMILEFVSLVRPFKDETNKCVHYDYKLPDEKYVNEWRIPRLVALAHRLFRKYCNP
jgi:hypothetical protein